MARVFQASIKADYVAGMWANTINQDLAWTRTPGTDADLAPRDSGYLAPSWSWASLYDTEVSMTRIRGMSGEVELATCEEVTTTPYGTDPLGRISNGALRLRCFAVPLETPKRNRDPSLFPNHRQVSSR